MARNSSRNRWLQRQQKDPYVKQAQLSHYRSRAVYKLMEIYQKANLFHQGQVVADLGAAPGSWSQYACEKVGNRGRVVSVDILDMEKLDNTLFIKGDFTEKVVFDKCLAEIGKSGADLVISDMAPNITGIRVMDQARSLELAAQALDFAIHALKPGGHFLLKLFEGDGIAEFRQKMEEHFTEVHTRIPRASRANSREFYVLGRMYKV